MGKIIVIGMGSSDFTQINGQALEIINSNNKIYSRTERHEVINVLKEIDRKSVV